MARSYKQLSRLETFNERYDYLKIQGRVGEATFGADRYINQAFYRSHEWKNVRNHVIARDLGMDLGCEGREIFDSVVIHHMNPMTAEEVAQGQEVILDPEFLITTTHNTHNAIHYGDASKLTQPFVERTRGDTNLW